MKWGIIAGVGLLVAWFIYKKLNNIPSYQVAYGPPPPAPANPVVARGGPPPPSPNQLLGQALGIPGAKYIDTADKHVGAPIRGGTDAINNVVNKNVVAPVKKFFKKLF